MLISQDRLAQLKEQQDYLEQLYDFTKSEAVKRLGKQGVANDQIEAYATLETNAAFQDAGLEIAAHRIKLEIDFLTDYFS